MIDIKEYIKTNANKHNGKAWIIGKGKSIDLFNSLNIDKEDTIVSINSAALVVRSKYVFFHDISPDSDAILNMSNCPIVIADQRHIDYVGSKKKFLADENRWNFDSVYYHKIDIDNLTHRDYKKVLTRFLHIDNHAYIFNSTLLGSCGTAHSAMHFLHLMGFNEVSLLGFDHHTPKYSKSIITAVPLTLKEDTSKKYLEIFEVLELMAKVLNIKLNHIQ